MRDICQVCGGDRNGPAKCPGPIVIPPKGAVLSQTPMKGGEVRDISDDTVIVVYAVRMSYDGGQDKLERLDQLLKTTLEADFPDDPLLRITRGEPAIGGSTPYRSAGFLHGGEPRVGDEPHPAGRPPLKLNCTHKGPIHNASCVRGD